MVLMKVNFSLAAKLLTLGNRGMINWFTLKCHLLALFTCICGSFVAFEQFKCTHIHILIRQQHIYWRPRPYFKKNKNIINNKIEPQKAATNSCPLTFCAVLMPTFRNINKSFSLTCVWRILWGPFLLPRPASVGTCLPRVFFNLVSLNCQEALWDTELSLGACFPFLFIKMKLYSVQNKYWEGD